MIDYLLFIISIVLYVICVIVFIILAFIALPIIFVYEYFLGAMHKRKVKRINALEKKVFDEIENMN
jgi:hypothetical protein